MALIMPTGSLPGQNPGALRSMQLQLLRLAEDTLGPRDASKTICRPLFADDGPFIRNTPNLDGAFAELSRNAEGYWPTVVYELAHETVHLLNPRPGVGNWLSEGISVAFSIYAQEKFQLKPQRVNMHSYRRSLKLVSALPPAPLEAGRRVREACGTLNNVTPGTIKTLFPNMDTEIVGNLCKRFDRDWTGNAHFPKEK